MKQAKECFKTCLHEIEARMLFMGSRSQFFHILMKTSLDHLTMYKLNTVFKENVNVTVLLEWLIALLEYLDIAFQVLNKLQGRRRRSGWSKLVGSTSLDQPDRLLRPLLCLLRSAIVGSTPDYWLGLSRTNNLELNQL